MISKIFLCMHLFLFPSILDSFSFFFIRSQNVHNTYSLFCWLKQLCRPAAFQEGLLYNTNMPTKLYIKQKNVTIYIMTIIFFDCVVLYWSTFCRLWTSSFGEKSYVNIYFSHPSLIALEINCTYCSWPNKFYGWKVNT